MGPRLSVSVSLSHGMAEGRARTFSDDLLFKPKRRSYKPDDAFSELRTALPVSRQLRAGPCLLISAFFSPL